MYKQSLRRSCWIVSFLCGSLYLPDLAAAPATDFVVAPVSVANPALSAPVTGNSDASASRLSADGRFVVFVSAASNLVTNDHSAGPLGSFLDVFIRDVVAGTTSLVSVDHTGTDSGDDHSNNPAVSADGRFVAFESDASNLVTNDFNNTTDIFLRDTVLGTTSLVSWGLDGASANGTSTEPVITPDGSFVAFVSAADNLVFDDINGIPDVFVRNLQTGFPSLVSVGAQASISDTPGSHSPVITPDGRFVAFTSTATNLVPGQISTLGEVFVRDLGIGVTFWASSNVESMLGTRPQSYNPVLSTDGRFVAFKAHGGTTNVLLWRGLETGVTTVISEDAFFEPLIDDQSGPQLSSNGRFVCYTTGRTNRVYVWDSQTGTNILVSANLDGTAPANGISDTPVISADGGIVAFLSNATGLTTNVTEGSFQVYVRDVAAGTTRLVSKDPATNQGLPSDALYPGLSADGRRVVFECYDSNLVSDDNNSALDIFLWNATGSAVQLVSAREPSLSSVTPNGPSHILASATSLSVDQSGRYVVFTSSADNLVTNDFNQHQDIFLRDLNSGTTRLVSLNASGTNSGNLPSTMGVISGNGNFVAFLSAANDLVLDDTNLVEDVFVRDVALGTTRLISIPTNITFTSTLNSLAISHSGRYVAFIRNRNVYLWDSLTTSVSQLNTNQGAGPIVFSPDERSVLFADIPTRSGLYLYDIVAQTREFLGTNTIMTTSYPAAVFSSDSRRLAFRQLISGQSFFYVRDLVRGTNVLANPERTDPEVVLSGPGGGDGPLVLSGDGRFLAYSSVGTNLVENDLNEARDVFVRDLQLGLTLLISARLGGGSANGDSDQPYISADGRYVTFRSVATDLVAEETHGEPNLYVRDLVLGTTRLLSAARFGSAGGNSRSSSAVISANSRVVVFESFASDLVAGDFNNQQDVFFTILDTSGIGSQNGLRLQLAPFAAGDRPTLSWAVEAGLSYQVQYRNALGSGQWLDLAAQVSVGGQTATVNDTSLDLGSQRFYRVRVAQ